MLIIRDIFSCVTQKMKNLLTFTERHSLQHYSKSKGYTWIKHEKDIMLQMADVYERDEQVENNVRCNMDLKICPSVSRYI